MGAMTPRVCSSARVCSAAPPAAAGGTQRGLRRRMVLAGSAPTRPLVLRVLRQQVFALGQSEKQRGGSEKQLVRLAAREAR